MTSEPSEAFTDREFHKTAPVPDTGRPSIYECRQPQKDWIGELFDVHAPLPARGRVLDAGCGPGAYITAARQRIGPEGTLVGTDLNHDRLRQIDPLEAPTATADVTALPFPDSVFDVALAMHMLYHVPDIPAAVCELHRVLRPGGVLYAFTNSETAQWELTELYLRHGGDDAKAMGDARFSNESGGALLGTGFAAARVELIEMRESELVVTDPECIVDEFQRLRYTLEPGLADGASWSEMIRGVRRDATAIIEREGVFRMSENHGLFVCRR